MKNVEDSLVFVKGGTFQMGDIFGDGDSDEKPHEVCLDGFYIGKYQVTQKQWVAVMGENPSYFKGDDRPVENVRWNDIQEFLGILNEKTGRSYRLPTEAEWEYAARSRGKQEKWAGTSNEAKLEDYAWYYNNNSDGKTHPVGQKKPNGLGIYDMTGNVWEWCQDWYDEDYYRNSLKDNPKGPSCGKYRVLRGGSWGYRPRYLRSAFRCSDGPTERGNDFGFRLVLPAHQ